MRRVYSDPVSVGPPQPFSVLELSTKFADLRFDTEGLWFLSRTTNQQELPIGILNFEF